MDILEAANRHSMLDVGDVVLVAVSGGPDSVAMLHALHIVSSKLGISLHIAHLNHGIRGEESNSDQVFVCELAQQYGIPISTARVDVPTLRIESGLGEEETARVERYEFLQDTATKLGADKIAIGHNADDRAESVLLNIIRGCGIDGLASIKPINGKVIRPLIDTPRADIDRYITENSLDYRLDKTNLDTTYARNRVRHELIALLERDYNPQIRPALVRLAEIAADQMDHIRYAAENAEHYAVMEDSLDAGLLAALPRALQSQIIRNKISEVKKDLVDVSYNHIESVIEGLKSGADFTVNLPTGEFFVSRTRNVLRVWRRDQPEPAKEYEIVLRVPGETAIADSELTLRCELVRNPKPAKLSHDEALLDAATITGKLVARSARVGDRIQPFGMTGTKKLQDIFVDKKIPRRDRARAAIICDDEKILWVAGVVSSELGKVTAKTVQAIHIVAAPHQST